MKNLSYVLGVAGVLLFIYAILGRFIGGPTVFGYIFALDAKTVVLGANTFLILAVLVTLYSKK